MAVLNSWKEISNYMGRGIRTLQRWEIQFGLPIRRPSNNHRSAVIALTEEIDEWLRSSAILNGGNIALAPEVPDEAVRAVLNTMALYHRPSRTVDHELRQAGIKVLNFDSAAPVSTILQTLTDLAVGFCNAGTAGLSVLRTGDDGELRFHWDYVAGALVQYKGNTTPKKFSPCGFTLALGTPQLFVYPASCFKYLENPHQPIVEALVVPINTAGQPFGTLWILSHNPAVRFDLGHVEIMTTLASFCAAQIKPEHHLVNNTERHTPLKQSGRAA